MQSNQPKVKITLYRWAGRKFGLEIHSPCQECDRSVQVIQELLAGEFRHLPVQAETRNWLDHLFKCLWHGGWHAPVVLVDGRLFSQGVIPDAQKLSGRIWQRLRRLYPSCPVCKDLLVQEDYPAHRRSETRQRILRHLRETHPEWVEPGGLCPRCLDWYERKVQSGELIV